MRLQHRLILLGLVHLEIVKELAALRHFAEEPATGREILLMFGKVLAEQIDLFGKNGDLHRRRACVALVRLMLRDETFLRGALEHGREWERATVARVRRGVRKKVASRASRAIERLNGEARTGANSKRNFAECKQFGDYRDGQGEG